jgi:hypothetical protein
MAAAAKQCSLFIEDLPVDAKHTRAALTEVFALRV